MKPFLRKEANNRLILLQDYLELVEPSMAR